MTTKWLIRVFGMIAIALILSATIINFSNLIVERALATEVIELNPTADAYVNSEQPDKNFGKNSALRVDGSPIWQVYLQFDLNGISSVQQATLQIYAQSAQRTGIDVFATSGDWDETSITFATAPASTSPLIGSSGAISAGSWITVDVTSAVQSASILNLLISTSDNRQLKMASRETGSTAPRLSLTVGSVDPSPTNTPQSPTATPTNTPQSPTATPTNTPQSPTATPTNTPQSPTATPTNTPQSPTATPTNTPQSPTATPTNTPGSPGGGSLNFPVRAAFYYPWFPEAWNQGGQIPFSQFEPTLGLYDTGNTGTIQQHISWMQYAKIQTGIASWWGPGHHTDSDLKRILDATDGTGFKWSIYHEVEGHSNPSSNAINQDLTYIRDNLASDPDFLRIDGKFVVFVYNANDFDCAVADRWMAAAQSLDAYIVLKVFPGYRNCQTQPDSWHQYGPATAADRQAGYSYTISPGFWHANENNARLDRDINRWRSDVRAMVASNEPWQLITTFNEWGEGTIIEPAAEWSMDYLDVLATDGNGSPTPTPTSTPSPTQTSTPTPSPTPTQTPSPTPTGPPGSETVRLVAVGDIACDPSSGSWNNNNGTANHCRHKYTSDVAINENPDWVTVLGDNQYEDGTLQAYQQSYGPTWGRLKDITLPVAGNHEYHTSGAQGFHDYFNWGMTYYWQPLSDSWGLIAVDTNCSRVGGCGVGSDQYKFIESVLTDHPDLHFIVSAHHPYWSTGNYHGDYNQSGYRALCNLYEQYGVDILLAGHDHNYQRYAPQDCDSQLDPSGIQAWVVGTGGKNTYSVDPSLEPNDVVNWSSGYGVLELDLTPNGYSWRFLRDNASVVDAGNRSLP